MKNERKRKRNSVGISATSYEMKSEYYENKIHVYVSPWKHVYIFIKANSLCWTGRAGLSVVVRFGSL